MCLLVLRFHLSADQCVSQPWLVVQCSSTLAVVWNYLMELCSRSLGPIAIACECGGSIDFQVAIDRQNPQVGVLSGHDRIVFESLRHMRNLRPKSRYLRFVASLGMCAQNRCFAKSVLMALEEKLFLPCLAAWSISDSCSCPAS